MIQTLTGWPGRPFRSINVEQVTGKTQVANEEANLSVLPHQVVLVESLATNVSDLLPRYLRKRFARELLVLAICSLCLLLGLLVITKVNKMGL